MTSKSSLPAHCISLILHQLPSQSDVAVMMRASKAIHSAGIKPLLRFGVTISDNTMISSFSHFILADPSKRAPHVRKLYVNISHEPRFEDDEDEDEDEDGDEQDGEDEGDEHVGDSAAITQHAKTLAEIIRKTTGLEDLRIDSCEEWLERAKSLSQAIISLEHLRRLQFHSIGLRAFAVIENIKSMLVEVDAHCYSEDISEPEDVLKLVCHHHATLEKLTAWYAEAEDATTQFPQLRALSLRRFSILDVSVLYKACPNLRYLELSAMDDNSDSEGLRSENKAHEKWKELDYVCGDLGALYGLALSCKVRRLEVDSVEPVERLHTLLTDTSPSHLVLRADHHGNRTLDFKKLPGILDVPAASSVTHLVMDASMSTLEGDAGALLTGLNRLAAIAPNLKYVLLNPMSCEAQYWEICRSQADVTHVRLGPMVGRELVRSEGLAFNDRSLGLSSEI